MSSGAGECDDELVDRGIAEAERYARAARDFVDQEITLARSVIGARGPGTVPLPASTSGNLVDAELARLENLAAEADERVRVALAQRAADLTLATAEYFGVPLPTDIFQDDGVEEQ